MKWIKILDVIAKLKFFNSELGISVLFRFQALLLHLKIVNGSSFIASLFERSPLVSVRLKIWLKLREKCNRWGIS